MKPLVGIKCFMDEDPSGIPLLFREHIEKYFRIVTIKELEQKPELYEDVQAVMFDPATYKPFVSLLPKMTSLKVLGTLSAGYNHMYDFPKEHLESHGIKMTYSVGTLNECVADLAIGLLMSVARNIVSGVQLAMGPTMPQFRVDDYGQEVTGSTLGIVGMGGIGYEAAKRAYLGFNMNVLYHNRRQRSSDDEKMVKATYYSSLHAMLPECDFVVIACALTPETTGMFGEQEFQLMKKTASIINVSRGPLINQEALATALTSGKIRSAALDVTAPEPLPRDHPLLKCPNCVIIPHYGSATFKTRLRMMRAVMDDIVAVLGNQQQKNELVLP